MKQFLITIAGVFIGLILFFVAIPFILIASLSGDSKPKAPKHDVVLRIDLRGEVSDQGASSGLAGLSSSVNTVDIIEKLTQAQTDAKVKGVYIEAPLNGVSPAMAEEVRAAVKRFRASGKFVTAYGQSFDGVSLTGYPVVSAADTIWMQESGDFNVSGLASEALFLRGFFDKIKAEPDFEQFKEYKNAANQYTQTSFTPAHREATTSLLTGLFDDLSAMAAADRGMTPEAFKALLQRTPLSAQDALKEKLVDQLGWPEDAEKATLKKAGDKSEMLDIEDYELTKQEGPVIAFVGGSGVIENGEGSPGLFGGSDGMHSDDIAKAIDDAVADKDVKAIVFRVDSPGGSATASDQIWRAVERAKEAKKPVVISMAGLAASGGYWVSMGADKIVSNQTTITGSIGVLAGKIVLEPTLNSVGFNTETIALGGPFVTAYSSEQKFTPEQRAAFVGSMQRIYDRFIANVAAGRKLAPEKVQEIAKGRVWTGSQALKLGLVDQIGGLYESVEVAKQLAKIDAKTKVQLRRFPAQKEFFELLEDSLGVSSGTVKAAALISALANDETVTQLTESIRAAKQTRGVQARADVDVR